MQKPIAILLCLFCFLLPAWLSGKTIEVCQNCEHQSIKQGLQEARDHDTLLVTNGHYVEGNIKINKQVVLIGEAHPVVDGKGETEIFTINADSVVIKGFQIQNVGTSYTKDRAGIRINEQKHCIIENNKLKNTFFGIYLEHADSCIVRNNHIIGTASNEVSSGNAIHLWYSEYSLIEDNITENHRDGIYFEFVEHSTIRNNISKDNIRYGLHFMFSHNNEYIKNTFKNNGAGVAVMFSRNIVMKQNLFIKNWGDAAYGLYLKEIENGTITQNRFVNNTYGIYFEGTNNMKVKQNLFENNGWAVEMMSSCLNNTLTRNNFISNNFDISTNTSSARSNTYNKNYWSKYTGYDLDKDDYGDVPYRPVKVFSYITSQTPETMIMLRSLFIDLMNFAEKVYPVFTPKALKDDQPLMQKVEIR